MDHWDVAPTVAGAAKAALGKRRRAREVLLSSETDMAGDWREARRAKHKERGSTIPGHGWMERIEANCVISAGKVGAPFTPCGDGTTPSSWL